MFLKLLYWKDRFTEKRQILHVLVLFPNDYDKARARPVESGLLWGLPSGVGAQGLGHGSREQIRFPSGLEPALQDEAQPDAG